MRLRIPGTFPIKMNSIKHINFFFQMVESLERRGKTKILWLTQPDVFEKTLWDH